MPADLCPPRPPTPIDQFPPSGPEPTDIPTHPTIPPSVIDTLGESSECCECKDDDDDDDDVDRYRSNLVLSPNQLRDRSPVVVVVGNPGTNDLDWLSRIIQYGK